MYTHSVLDALYLLKLINLTPMMQQAKKLHSLIWTLILHTGLSEDPRMMHIQILWFRQIKILDSEGGLMLRAFNFRMTYVNIIQVNTLNLYITYFIRTLTETLSVDLISKAIDLDVDYSRFRFQVLGSFKVILKQSFSLKYALTIYSNILMLGLPVLR